MRRVFLIVILFSLRLSFAQRAVLFNGQYAQPQDKLLAMTLAGIVNRDSARLYLLNVYETWSYNRTDEAWAEIYKQRAGIQFDTISNVTALVNRFRQLVNGGIRYDANQFFSNFSGQNFRWQGEYACLIGGLTDRLPVTSAMAASLGLQLNDSVVVHDYFDANDDIYVPGLLDHASLAWNAAGLTDEARYLKIVDWGINNLLPRCNPARFYIREITDFAVKHRMFQLNLAGTDDLRFESLSDQRAELLERVLRFLHGKNPARIFQIYGWMRPEPLVQWLGYYGASFNETLLSNLSWHSAVQVNGTVFNRASIVNPQNITLEDKHYVIFIGTEGDAGNWVIGLQSGAWLSAKRGNVPVGWGFNLHLLAECPFIAKYYSETATANDGFLAVTSPLGYSYPDLWQNDVWQNAVDTCRKLADFFKVYDYYGYKHYANGDYNTVYRNVPISNSFNFSAYGRFLRNAASNTVFTFDPMLPNQYPVTAYGGLIFNHSDDSFYGDVSNLNTAAARIVSGLRNKTRPSFTIAGYQRFRQDDFNNRTDPSSVDINFARLEQLAALLKTDTTDGRFIELVTPERFSALLRKKLNLSGLSNNEYNNSNFDLEQNFPNPFNSSSVIRYSLQEPGHVSLCVYDVLGNVVKTLADAWQGRGVHQVSFDGSNLSAGIYFYVLKSGAFKSVKKMLYLK